MADTLETLIVRMEGDISQLRSELGQAENVTQQTSSRMSRSFQRVGAELRKNATKVAKWGAAAAAVAVGGLAALIRSTANVVDQMTKKARAVGLATEAIFEMEHVANITGVSVDQLAMAVQRAERFVGDAAVRGGEYTRALELMGLQTRELANMNAEERFWAIAEAIQGIEDPTLRTSLAMQALGRQGAQMLRLMGDNADAIRDLRQEARDLGLVVDAFDAHQIEQFNDNVTRLRGLWTGFARQLTAELAPVLVAITDELFHMAKQAGGTQRLATSAFEMIAKAAGFVADALDGIRRVFLAVGEGSAVFVLTFQRDMVAAGDAVRDQLIRPLNAYIRLRNRITGLFGLEVEEFEPGRWQEQAAQLERAVEEGRAAMARLRDEPMPSVGIDEWFKRVQERTEAAREEFERTQREIALGTYEEPDGVGTPTREERGEEERRQKRLEENLAMLRQEAASELELEREKHEEKMSLLEELFEQEMLEEEERDHIREEMERDHMERMEKIRKDSLTDLQRFNEMIWKDQTKTILDEMVAVTQGVAQHSKALFQINKVAAIAQAIMDAHSGAARTLARYPWPVGPALAALHYAAGMARVAAIKGTSFQGGGGGSAPSVAGTTPAQPVSDVGSGGGGQTAERTGIIQLVGDSFGRTHIRELSERIWEEYANGVKGPLRVVVD